MEKMKAKMEQSPATNPVSDVENGGIVPYSNKTGEHNEW
jgi:phage pi2 protein 07